MHGRKAVIFITGLCPVNCFYCPISAERRGKDLTFVNERQVSSLKELLEEVELMDAEGAGITGGEPLVRLERTINYIRELKKHFGKDFHIHLYTSSQVLSDSKVRKLEDAGLDELRVHVVDRAHWNTVTYISREFSHELSVGLEMPVLPDKGEELYEMIEFLSLKGEIDFVNLNELEFSETNASSLLERGYVLRKDSMVAAQNSYETGIQVLRRVYENGLPVSLHLCPAAYKDTIQTSLRYYRRGLNVAKTYELVTDEGLMTYAIVSPVSKELEGCSLIRDLEDVYFSENAVHISALKLIPMRCLSRVRIVEETPTYERIRVSEEEVSC